ncbi:hypothetical protein U1Q18_034286 [Sarracenia purpurea var. burkii]
MIIEEESIRSPVTMTTGRNSRLFGRFLIIVTCFLTVALIVSRSAEASVNHHRERSWMPQLNPGACRGSIAECMAAGEFEMESEVSRRILATTKYISYAALQADSVPCSQRGASYYNCKAGAQANPYSRGCSAITRCRS